MVISPNCRGVMSVSIPRSGFCSFKRYAPHCPQTILLWFQSLGRDSVHSSGEDLGEAVASTSVSIPRSGFCSFKLGALFSAMFDAYGFNPSVGILFIQALCAAQAKFRGLAFQSLGRDSVHSSSTVNGLKLTLPLSFNPSVGILFIQAFGHELRKFSLKFVSIPRSGFCSFKLGCGNYVHEAFKFQSLGRDSVHSS